MDVWLPLKCPLLGTWPTTQACALTGNGSGDPLVHSPVLNPESHQPGLCPFFNCIVCLPGVGSHEFFICFGD